MKKKVWIVSVIHFLVSLYTDTLVFDITSGVRYYMLKAVFLPLLMLLWYGVFYLAKHRNTSEFMKNMVRYTGIYYGIMLLILLVVWPGIWRWDEFSILDASVSLQMHYWQHFLTSLVYIFSLMCIPIPGGIVLIQITLISIVVGYVLATIQSKKSLGKGIYVLMLIFLLPAVIDNNFYPIRTSLYAYLELFLLFYLIRQYELKRPITWLDLGTIAIIGSVLVTWRSESIYYIVFIPLLVLLSIRQKLELKKILAFVFVFLSLTLCITSIQSHGTKRDYGDEYFLTSMINPLGLMLLQENDEEMIEAVDAVMDVEILREHASPYGINAYYVGGLVRQDATEADYSLLKKTYVKMIIKHFPDFLKYRMETLIASSGLRPDIRINIYDASEIFDRDAAGELLKPNYTRFDTYPLTDPLNIPLRKGFIRFIEGREIQDINKATILYPVFYNVIGIALIAMALFVYYWYKREWLLLCYVTGLLVKFSLIFMANPSKIFMYYFPLYLSVVFLTGTVLIKVKKQKI